jgi:hypothetical protein
MRAFAEQQQTEQHERNELAWLLEQPSLTPDGQWRRDWLAAKYNVAPKRPAAPKPAPQRPASSVQDWTASQLALRRDWERLAKPSKVASVPGFKVAWPKG